MGHVNPVDAGFSDGQFEALARTVNMAAGQIGKALGRQDEQ